MRNIVWLPFTIHLIKAAGDSFLESVRNCYRFEYFEKPGCLSFIHCGMTCLKLHQCQAFSYDYGKMNCRLHLILSKNCSLTKTENEVTFQRKQTVESCHFQNGEEIIQGAEGHIPRISADDSVDLASECGKFYFSSPIVFDLEGTGHSQIVFAMSYYYYDRWLEAHPIYINFRINNQGKPKVEMDIFGVPQIFRAKARKGSPFECWINFESDRNGSRIFKVGEGHSVGHYTFFEVKTKLTFENMTKLLAVSKDGKFDWLFYGWN